MVQTEEVGSHRAMLHTRVDGEGAHLATPRGAQRRRELKRLARSLYRTAVPRRNLLIWAMVLGALGLIVAMVGAGTDARAFDKLSTIIGSKPASHRATTT